MSLLERAQLASILLSSALLSPPQPSSTSRRAEPSPRNRNSLLQVVEQRIGLILRSNETGEGLLGDAAVLELGEHELVVAREEGAVAKREGGRLARLRGRRKGEGGERRTRKRIRLFVEEVRSVREGRKRRDLVSSSPSRSSRQPNHLGQTHHKPPSTPSHRHGP